MPTYLLLIGGPGAGKGTQAEALVEKYGLPHVASGDLFRENLQQSTELGQLAKGFMDRGELVPDDVTISMIRRRLQQPDAVRGAILDGFPRTVPQAEALDRLLAEFGGEVEVVLYINVPEQLLLERLSGRWVCRGTPQHVYNLASNPPQVAGVCDVDGTPLFQRADDTAEVQAKRIQVYLRQTAPLIDYYRQRGLLVDIDGTQEIPAVTADLIQAIDAAAARSKA